MECVLLGSDVPQLDILVDMAELEDIEAKLDMAMHKDLDKEHIMAKALVEAKDKLLEAM